MGLLRRMFGRKKELNTEQKERLRKLNKACGILERLDAETVKQYYQETKRLEGQGFDVSPHDCLSEAYYKRAFKK